MPEEEVVVVAVGSYQDIAVAAAGVEPVVNVSSSIVGVIGPDGPTGPANTLSIGTVVPGEEAAATITGIAPDQTLSLVLPKGDDGDPGAPGAPGRDGNDGFTPIKGVDYFDGATGPQGPPGAQGLTGPQGAQGIQGDPSFVPGPPGPQGIQGIEGPEGPAGADSFVPGPMGPQGPDGPEGPAGQDSTVPGPPGMPGNDGYTPIKGVDYFDGAPGLPGADGLDGAPGADAVINGVNTLTIVEGSNVNLSQAGSELTISATVPTISDLAYDSTWNDDTDGASKNAIYDKIQTLGRVYYNPASLTVNTGTLNQGVVGDLSAVGGTDVIIQEASGADPLRFTLGFTNVARMSSIEFYGYYAGGSGHIMNVEIYNPNTTAWNFLGEVGTASSKRWYSFNIFMPNDYMNAGAVQIRFRHVQSGITSHSMILDYLDINDGGAGGSSYIGASTVGFTPNGNIIATNVQSAIQELDTEKAPALGTDDNYVTDAEKSALHAAGSDDQDASEVAFTPYGTIEATNVQTAIQEVIDEAGGGQILYTTLVAPVDGDYTTLGAAIAAASAGDTIFVANGAYTETGNITSSLANLTIIGANTQSTVVNLSSYVLTLSGAGVTIRNLTLQASTGGAAMTGNYGQLQSCKIIKSVGTTNNGMNVQGSYSQVTNNIFDDTTSADGGTIRFILQGASTIVSNNTFNLRISNNGGQGPVSFDGSKMVVTNNAFYAVSGSSAGAYLITWYSSGGEFSGNTLYENGSVSTMLYVGVDCVVSSNTIIGGTIGINSSNGFVNITGNIVKSIGTAMLYGIFVKNGISDTVINGNTVYGSSTTVGSMIGIRIGTGSNSNTDNCVITGNRVHRCITGVHIYDATCDSNTVSGNNLSGNGTDLIDAGTNTITDARMFIDSTPLSRNGSGTMTKATYGESITHGDLLYIHTDGTVLKADNTSIATAKLPGMAIALETASSGSRNILLMGHYTDSIKWNGATLLTVGGLIYMGAAGAMTQTQPATTDNVIQVVGVATGTNKILFNPQLTYITRT